MKCKLYKQVDHSKIREQFRQTHFHCPLLQTEDIGMSSLGVICGGCCIRIQQLLATKKDLILRQIMSAEDYKRNPDVIEEHLPEHLIRYFIALKRIGRKLEEASAECSRCKPAPIESQPTYSSKAIEMTECSRDDLR